MSSSSPKLSIPDKAAELHNEFVNALAEAGLHEMATLVFDRETGCWVSKVWILTEPCPDCVEAPKHEQ